MKKENFVQWNKRIFSQAFEKIDLNIVWMVLIDAIFYLFLGLSVLLWGQRMKQKYDSLNLASPQEAVSMGLQNAQAMLQGAKEYYYVLVFSLVLIILAIILTASIIKFFIWAKVTKTKYSIHLFSKFLTLNLIWMSLWIVLIFAAARFAQVGQVQVYIVALATLGLYFTSILYPLFMVEKRISVIGKSLYIAISKIKYPIIPFAVFLFLLFWIIKIGIAVNFRFAGYLYTAILLSIAAYYRYYSSAIVNDIANK